MPPRLFGEWGAITAISGALERRCYTRVVPGRVTFPNLYVWLVATPGVGKGLVIDEVERLWRDTGTLNVAPESVTGKGLVDAMIEIGGVGRIDVATQSWEQYTSMLVVLPEFGTFLSDYDTVLINILNRIYDCGPMFEDRTRGGGLKKIEKPHLAILAGTQPAYIGHVFPRIAFELGLTSRTVLVWGAPAGNTIDLFAEAKDDRESYRDLLHDLRIITSLAGEFKFSHPAKVTLQEWITGGMQPQPEHPLLEHYKTRRLVHVIKASCCYSASRESGMEVSSEDVLSAVGLLTETESEMPHIFRNMGSQEQVQDLHQIMDRIKTMLNGSGLIRRQQVWQAMQICGIKTQYMVQTLQSMEESGLLQQTIPGEYKVGEGR